MSRISVIVLVLVAVVQSIAVARSLNAPREPGQGLTTPNKFFGSKTKAQAEAALEAKFGPPRSTRPHAKTYYNPKTKRSFNVHQEPGHQGGRPHVDVRKRGNVPERKFDLDDN